MVVDKTLLIVPLKDTLRRVCLILAKQGLTEAAVLPIVEITRANITHTTLSSLMREEE